MLDGISDRKLIMGLLHAIGALAKKTTGSEMVIRIQHGG
jgi:hypothetical protein